MMDELDRQAEAEGQALRNFRKIVPQAQATGKRLSGSKMQYRNACVDRPSRRDTFPRRHSKAYNAA